MILHCVARQANDSAWRMSSQSGDPSLAKGISFSISPAIQLSVEQARLLKRDGLTR
jgi:hypothetical protein